jgi:hypothetical protein
MRFVWGSPEFDLRSFVLDSVMRQGVRTRPATGSFTSARIVPVSGRLILGLRLDLGCESPSVAGVGACNELRMRK